MSFWREIEPEQVKGLWGMRGPPPETQVRIGCSDEDYARLERGDHVPVLLDLNGALFRVVIHRPQTQLSLLGT